MSLLDKATSIPGAPGHKAIEGTDEEVALALAWFHRRVTTKQVAYALDLKALAHANYWAATVLRLAIDRGQVQLTEARS